MNEIVSYWHDMSDYDFETAVAAKNRSLSVRGLYVSSDD